MVRFNLFSVTLVALLICLPGCQKTSYMPYCLQHVDNVQNAQTQNGVRLQVKKLSRAQAQEVFNGKAGCLLRKRKPIYPLLLTLENNSQYAITLDPKNIPIKLVRPEVAAARLHFHTHRRVITSLLLGLSTATVTFFAAAYVTIIGTISAVPSLVKTGYAALGLSALFAIGTPFIAYNQGVNAQSVNDAIDQEILSKSLGAPVIIYPNQSIKLLLFAHYSLPKQPFCIKLINENQTAFLFSIDLKEGVAC